MSTDTGRGTHADEPPSSAAQTVDVLAYPAAEGGTTHRIVDAGRGDGIVDAHIEEYRKRVAIRRYLCAALSGGAVGLAGHETALEGVATPLFWGVLVCVGVYLAAPRVGMVPPLDDLSRQDLSTQSGVVPTIVAKGIPRETAERQYGEGG